jgi:hypothetical protein
MGRVRATLQNVTNRLYSPPNKALVLDNISLWLNELAILALLRIGPGPISQALA